MEKGVAVTGMGIISAIGNNVEDNYKSLVDRRTGISLPHFLQTQHSHLPVGEVALCVLGELVGQQQQAPEGWVLIEERVVVPPSCIELIRSALLATPAGSTAKPARS